MRELTSLTDGSQAKRFAAFLFAESIPCTVENEDSEWTIWIHSDDDRDRAEELLTEYISDPDNERYARAERKVRNVLQEADRLRSQNQQRARRLKRRWNGSWWDSYPATYIMFVICVLVVALCTNWNANQGNQGGAFGPRLCNSEEIGLKPPRLPVKYLQILDDEGNAARNRAFLRIVAQRIKNGNLPRQNVKLSALDYHTINAQAQCYGLWSVISRGQLWRLITPIFMHMSLLHIGFNMMAFMSFGKGVEYVRGTRRFLVLCLILAVTSNIVQLLWVDFRFGGMSGVLFGLVGYVWMKGKTRPRDGLALNQNTVTYALLWLFLCMTGVLGNIANGAHLGGLVAGMIIGARQTIWKSLPFVNQRPSGS